MCSLQIQGHLTASLATVNFLVFVIFFVIIFNRSEKLLPDCTVLTFDGLRLR